MASDDAPERSGPVEPRRYDERQDSGDDRSPVFRRFQEAQKVEALLEVIEFSGVDLLNHSSKLAFQERLTRARLKDDKRKSFASRRAIIVWGALGTIGGWLVTFEFPKVAAWLNLP